MRAAAILLAPNDPILQDIRATQLADPTIHAITTSLQPGPARESNPSRAAGESQYLRIYTDYQQSDWSKLLPLAEFTYNNSKHSATTLSPFFANYGFHPQMSLLPRSPNSPNPAADDYVKTIHDTQDFLQSALRKS